MLQAAPVKGCVAGACDVSFPNFRSLGSLPTDHPKSKAGWGAAPHRRHSIPFRPLPFIGCCHEVDSISRLDPILSGGVLTAIVTTFERAGAVFSLRQRKLPRSLRFGQHASGNAPDDVKRGIFQAGGFPIELRALSVSENVIKPTSMLYSEHARHEGRRAYPLAPGRCGCADGWNGIEACIARS